VPLDQLRTETFTVLAMCQWFNVLNCQSATRLGTGPAQRAQPLAAAGLARQRGAAGLVLYAPPLNRCSTPCRWRRPTLLLLLALASVVLWVEELRKLGMRVFQGRRLR
jgi:Ca2+-transporting ATPase